MVVENDLLVGTRFAENDWRRHSFAGESLLALVAQFRPPAPSPDEDQRTSCYFFVSTGMGCGTAYPPITFFWLAVLSLRLLAPSETTIVQGLG
jgi:hypothetical protein